MTNLVIYDESKQGLSEISFVKDTLNQVKIRDINNSYELTKQLGMIFTIASNHLGIKNPIEQITKDDIMELILSRFKNLSINEIAYAFKIERYCADESKINHFQLFNAEYVSAVLEKWNIKKRDIKKINNISVKYETVEMSEKEKKYWINKGVIDCLNFFIENEYIEDGKLYIYDVLYDLDYLPKDIDYKNKIEKSAIECIEVEQRLRKPKSKEDVQNIKYILNEITKSKSGIVIKKCKELVLCQFFRGLIKDNDNLKEFKTKFKNQDNDNF